MTEIDEAFEEVRAFGSSEGESKPVYVWTINSVCGGPVTKRKLFGQQDIYICDLHTTEHREIMGCDEAGLDIEKVVRWSSAVRRRIMASLGIFPSGSV